MPHNLTRQGWFPVFLHFLTLIKITSKEMIEPAPMEMYRAQELFLESLTEGLDEGVHHFVCLKARQLGISTILLALDIFWLYMHPGTQGALIADTGENVQTFRQTITDMLDSLPRGFKVPVKSHNRMALVLANGSRLQYMSAGKNKNSGLGRSRALNFVHASECSSWGDQKGLDSLLAALAEENPNRLYIFESTALGFNLFHDMYEEATESTTQKAFFIGWWAKDVYRITQTIITTAGVDTGLPNPEFERWWGANPALTEYELTKTAEVEERYGYTITEGQWAWYRRKASSREEGSLQEEFPTTEDEAFVVTGNSFFNLQRVTTDLRFISGALTYDGYSVTLGQDFRNTYVASATNRDDVDLRVWEEPRKTGRYVMGVDPAYGSSEEADRTVISIWRCYADRLIQVAEYATRVPTSQQAAWVMAYLGSRYKDCRINLEINGPGAQVQHEIKALKQRAAMMEASGPLPEDEAISRRIAASALDGIKWFLWHRVDATGGGYSYNFKTSVTSKAQIMNGFRDAYSMEQMLVRSVPLLDEMTTMVQDGDSIAASGRNKDDRVMGAALAHVAWQDWVRPAMLAENQTYDIVTKKEAEADERGGSVIANIIPGFFAEQEAKRNAAEIRALLSGNGI